MIERTAFDLRIAAHQTTTVLVALAARPGPARQAPGRRIGTTATA